MTRRAEAAAGAVERRVRELADGHERALRAAKEAWASGERARRDKAIKEREAAVRETTIRGLEPEVRRLMDKHRCVNVSWLRLRVARQLLVCPML